MERFVTVEEFIRSGIHRIYPDRPRLRAVFASYNHIPRMPPGEFASGHAELSLVLATSEQEEPILPSLARSATAYILRGEPLTRVASVMRETDRPLTMLALEEQVFRLLRTDADVERLLILYSGFSAWRRSVEVLRAVKEAEPRTTSFILTCTCQLEENRKAFAAAFERGMPRSRSRRSSAAAARTCARSSPRSAPPGRPARPPSRRRRRSETERRHARESGRSLPAPALF